METSRNERVIITTKISNYSGHFRGFVTLDEINDWGVSSMLIKHFYADIFLRADDSFRSRFAEFKIKDPDSDEELSVDISDTRFIDKPEFKRQIVDNPAVFKVFSDALSNSEFLKKYLLRNKDGSIWVMPTINDGYKDENISYIESIIGYARQNCSELILLLHDKDIYATTESIKHHKVAKGDTSLSTRIQEDSPLMPLINGGKVFVFIHNSDEDTYCKSVVNNEELSKMTIKDISDVLDKSLLDLPKNIVFSTRLGKVRRFSDMQEIIKDADDRYDFSKVFM